MSADVVGSCVRVVIFNRSLNVSSTKFQSKSRKPAVDEECRPLHIDTSAESVSSSWCLQDRIQSDGEPATDRKFVTQRADIKR